MILAFFSNSMIFPGMENAFFIFQDFHDFPGRLGTLNYESTSLGSKSLEAIHAVTLPLVAYIRDSEPQHNQKNTFVIYVVHF